MAVLCNDPNRAERINQFALVQYIPEPLGGFLDRQRQRLVPSCHFRSHVTILPPRPIQCTVEDALQYLERQIDHCPAFELTLGEVETFPVTSVIYLGLGSGRDQIVQMHEDMNTECLAYKEPFPFHPHVTLAQEFPLETVESLASSAREEWRKMPYNRSFPIDTLTFVQRTVENTWVNLAEYHLKMAVASR